MKGITSIFVALISINCFGQYDSCCNDFDSSIRLAKKGQIGFSTNRRLDNTANFLKDIDLRRYRFTSDYTGTLKSPSLLFNELDLSSYDLLVANLTFSDRNDIQKIVFAPFKLDPDFNNYILSNAKI